MSDPSTTALTVSEIEALINDLLCSREHCPARDVIAAGLLANMRDALRTIAEETSDPGARAYARSVLAETNDVR